MTTAQDTWKPRSAAADWEAAMFLPFPASRAGGEFLGMDPGAWTAPGAQMQLMWVESMCTWLNGWRRMNDIWREAIRDRQDAFIAGVRDQLARSAAQRPGVATAQAATETKPAEPRTSAASRDKAARNSHSIAA